MNRQKQTFLGYNNKDEKKGALHGSKTGFKISRARSGRVVSGQEVFKISRVGPGHPRRKPSDSHGTRDAGFHRGSIFRPSMLLTDGAPELQESCTHSLDSRACVLSVISVTVLFHGVVLRHTYTSKVSYFVGEERIFLRSYEDLNTQKNRHPHNRRMGRLTLPN